MRRLPRVIPQCDLVPHIGDSCGDLVRNGGVPAIARVLIHGYSVCMTKEHSPFNGMRIDNMSGRMNGCSWCSSQGGAKTQNRLADSFCWTKMQAEAGQELPTIIHRKELERTAGGGRFYWGIGNSVGARLGELSSQTADPQLLFSVMATSPKRLDTEPSSVLLWREYTTVIGAREPVPEHAIILSRGHTSTGKRKERHYALVCRSDEPLAIRRIGVLDLGHFRNLGSSGRGVGSSQVTAVIEHQRRGEGSGKMYEVSMRASLAYPYCLNLCNPVEVRPELLAELGAFSAATPERAEWLAFVRRFRRAADAGGSR